MATIFRPPLTRRDPCPRRPPSPDSSNLLTTTLGVAAPAMPSGRPVDDILRRSRFRSTAASDPVPNLLTTTLGVTPAPFNLPLDPSVIRRVRISVQDVPNVLPLTFVAAPTFGSVDLALRRARTRFVEDVANLLPLNTPVAAPFVNALDLRSFIPRRVSQIESINLLSTLYSPVQGTPFFGNAEPIVRRPLFQGTLDDYLNLLLSTLGTVETPFFGYLDPTARRARFQSNTDSLNLILTTLGTVVMPFSPALDITQRRQRQRAVDDAVNLLTTTLSSLMLFAGDSGQDARIRRQLKKAIREELTNLALLATPVGAKPPVTLVEPQTYRQVRQQVREFLNLLTTTLSTTGPPANARTLLHFLNQGTTALVTLDGPTELRLLDSGETKIVFPT